MPPQDRRALRVQDSDSFGTFRSSQNFLGREVGLGPVGSAVVLSGSSRTRSVQCGPKMFWKNSAWSWDDDDDGGFLLAADLRTTPDPALDTDQNSTNTVTNQSKCPTSALTGPKDPVRPSVTYCRPLSLDSANANVSGAVSTLFGTTTHLQVSPESTRTSPEPGSERYRVPGADPVLKGGFVETEPGLNPGLFKHEVSFFFFKKENRN